MEIERYSKIILRKIKPFSKNIVAVYIFGSVLNSPKRPPRDIDLAFLFKESFFKKNPFKSFSIAHTVGGELSEVFKIPVDVIVLNNLSISFTYTIITEGVCIYRRSDEERINYEIKIKGLYYDFRPFLDRLYKAKIKRLDRQTRD